MKVCWFSTGVSSFMACYLASDIDKILYTHVSNQHPDSLRFLHDCESVLNREITILKSKRFASVDDVIMKRRAINTPYGAPCTVHLKKDVRKEWERENPGHHIYVWGFDVNEKERARRLVKAMPDYEHVFPLIEHGITKLEAHQFITKLGIRRPAMYDLGYSNNNCIGCVKGGMWYWNKIRQDFPEVFARRAKQEREIGHSCIKGVFLDELEPGRGRKQDEIATECGINCELSWLNLKEELKHDEKRH